MSLDALSDVNYGAVAVAALAWFVLGAVWYARPVFGRAWGEAMGIAQDAGPNPMLFVLNYVGWFVIALALAYVGLFLGVDTAGEGIGLGLLTGLGIMLPLVVVGSAYEQRPAMAQWINLGYNLLGFVLMGLILGIWT